MNQHVQSCCGRAMGTIGLQRANRALTLHTCATCGAHVWESEGALVDQGAVLAALRPAPPVTARTLDATTKRRLELQRLLLGFSVHGSPS